MAYPYVCDPCLDGEHDKCVIRRGEGLGVGFCICSHGIGVTSAFELDRRKMSEESRAKENKHVEANEA